jgi:chromosome segregation ATPase
MKERIFALMFFMAALASTPVRADDSKTDVPTDVPEEFQVEELNNAKLDAEMEYNQEDELTAQKIEADVQTKTLRKDIQSEKVKLVSLKKANNRKKDQIQDKLVALRTEQQKLAEVQKDTSKESATLDKQANKLNELKAHVDSVREKKSQTREKLSQTKSQLRDIEKEIRSLERESKSSKMQIAKWNSEYKRLATKKAKRVAHARKVSKEASKHRQQAERAKGLALNNR